MKKLKFLTLAAIAAATAMVSSCSDNGDLSTPTKETEGKALIVNATLNDSRVTPLAKSAFTGFKLFGVQNPNTSNQSVGSFVKTGDASGVNFSGSFGSSQSTVSFTYPSSGVTANWPTTYPDNSANFYAISAQGGSDLTGSGISYTEDGIANGTFTYTAPLDANNNVDLSAQKDIMIASSLEATQSTNDGVVTLPFKHAFAKLTIQIRWNAYEWIENGNTALRGTITPYARLFVKYIKFHNIKCNGTYSFTADDGNGGNGKWTVNGENSTITYEFDTPLQFTATNVESTADNPFEVQDLLTGDKSIMILPQTVSAFKTINTGTGVFTGETSKAYLELGLFSYGMDDGVVASFSDQDMIDYYNNTTLLDDADNAANFMLGFGDYDYDNEEISEWAPVYIPIKTSSGSFVFEANKSYNFRLSLSQGLNDTGAKVLQTVEVTNG
ncbi:MAG: fimbrillin family protein [Prevotella sp.]|nr:fimbrillin family protein [Prevotella sp.]